MDAKVIDQALTETKIEKTDYCAVVKDSIDLLDKIRKRYKGSVFPSGDWAVKQALDFVITGLKDWRTKNC